MVAQRLRELGHDVVSVAEESTLRAMTDEDVYAWAAEERRRIVTDNVRDFRRLLVHAQQSGGPQVALLLTSSRVFPRVRRNPGPLEDWLRPA